MTFFKHHTEEDKNIFIMMDDTLIISPYEVHTWQTKEDQFKYVLHPN